MFEEKNPPRTQGKRLLPRHEASSALLWAAVSNLGLSRVRWEPAWLYSSRDLETGLKIACEWLCAPWACAEISWQSPALHALSTAWESRGLANFIGALDILEVLLDPFAF